MSPRTTFGAAFAVLALTAATHAQENDLPKFSGNWSVTAAELAGEPAPELVGAMFAFDGSSAKFTQNGPDGKPITDTHPFKIDVKTKRLVLYQAPNPEEPEADPKAGMQRGIYKFGTSALYLCLTAPDATEFPTEFSSKPEFLMLKLERSKVAAGAAPSATK